jgi:hypothetical protein
VVRHLHTVARSVRRGYYVRNTASFRCATFSSICVRSPLIIWRLRFSTTVAVASLRFALNKERPKKGADFNFFRTVPRYQYYSPLPRRKRRVRSVPVLVPWCYCRNTATALLIHFATIPLRYIFASFIAVLGGVNFNDYQSASISEKKKRKKASKVSFAVASSRSYLPPFPLLSFTTLIAFFFSLFFLFKNF